MKRWGAARSPGLAVWLAVGICSSVAVLGWFGYRATREFQRSSRLLAQRRADDAARLVVTALTRDMRGASESTLSSPVWEGSDLDLSHDVVALVASAFARYPYPEMFFAWDSRKPQAQVVFYTRPDRPPPWAPAPAGRSGYPVLVLAQRDVGERVLALIPEDASAGRQLSVSHVEVRGTQYQIVALLKYSDRLAQRLESFRGFVVNLPWTQQHYFPELLRQVLQISGEETALTLAIVDDRQGTIAGRRPDSGTFVSQKHFPLTFSDPTLIPAGAPSHAVPASWTVLAGATSERAVGALLGWPELALALITLGGLALALGLISTVHATRASADLTEIRADFIASVTHELKTPIASIQAMGETLSRGRLRDPKAEQEYAAVLTQEAKRLGRLVENLLAYSRLTDVAEVYSFEPLDLDDLVGASLAHFNPVFNQRCAISVDIPPDLPSIYADRAAMELLLDNLIDNAIRHSRATHIRITAETGTDEVPFAIADCGAGIPRDDLARVTQKFVRGRTAAAGGSGLGLAIVARIVEDHRGRFTIESSLGEGTTVRVVLPAASNVVARAGRGARRR